MLRLAVMAAMWAAAAGCTGPGGEARPTNPEDRTDGAVDTLTVVLIRHAEKAAEPDGDPVLTAVGNARAEALAHVLERVPITAIYGTDRRRTQETVAPLAAARGMPVGRIEMDDVDGMVAAIRSHERGVVVVAAHNHTSHLIVEKLVGRPAIEPIPDPDHDDMFVITLIRDAPGSEWAELTTFSLQYGQPTPAEAR